MQFHRQRSRLAAAILAVSILLAICVAPRPEALTPTATAQAIAPRFASAPSPTYVGSIGGRVDAVTASGDYIYLGEGDGLSIFDNHKRSMPTRIAHLPLGQFVRDIQIIDRLAYIVTGRMPSPNPGTFQVVDVSNPAKPWIRASYQLIDGESVQIVGGLAFIASGSDGLRIIDITDLGHLRLVGSYARFYISGVCVVGHLAYLTDTTNLLILDISNPAAPALIGSYDTPGNAYAVQVAGARAYVADHDDLAIVDVSDPAAPKLQSQIQAPADDLQVVGTTAYVVGLQQFSIINIANSSQPMLLGSYALEGSPNELSVIDKLAYTANAEGGLQIVDISDSTKPKRFSEYASGFDLADIQVVGNLVYGMSNYPPSLQIIDIANPANPTLRGSWRFASYGVDVEIVGDRAYALDGSGLHILDVHDPAQVRYLGDFALYGRKVQVIGNLAYVAGGPGVLVLDVSNPAAPIQVGSYSLAGGSNDIQIVGQLGYVTSGLCFHGQCNGQLSILDLSNPASILLVGTYATGRNANDVEVVGSRAYVAAGPLQIVDISDPAHPSLIINYEPPGLDVAHVQVVDDIAYVAGIFTLQAIDVHTPSTPVQLGSYAPIYVAYDLQVVGRLVYVAHGEQGLLVLHINRPEDPSYYLPFISFS